MGVDIFHVFRFQHVDHGGGTLGCGRDVVLGEHFDEGGRQFYGGCGEKVLAVEPPALDIVELRAGFRALGEVELGNQLIHAHDFLIIAGIPAEEGEEVDDGLWEIAAFAITAADCAVGGVPFEGENGESELVAVAFREFAVAGGLEQEGKVGETRHGVGPTEGAIEQNVEGCGGQPLFTADHVGDFHEMVVDNVGQMVGGQLIGALVEHFVVENRGIDDHIAANEVVDVHIFAGFDLETHHILIAACNACFHFFGGERERVLHLSARGGIILEIGDAFSSGIQGFGRVEGDVGFAFCEELIDIVLINVATFALAIRTFVAAEANALVKLNAEPLK